MIFLHMAKAKASSFSPDDIAGLQLWLDANQGVTLSGVPETQIDDPTDISNCALWLDAAQEITVVDGLVSTWNDLSGNSRNFSQGSESNRPTYVLSGINGLPIIRCDTSNYGKFLSCSSGLDILQNVSGATLAIIHKPAGYVTDSICLCVCPPDPDSMRAGFYRDNSNYRAGGQSLDGDSAGYASGYSSQIYNKPMLEMGVFDFANSNLYHYIDSVLVDTNTSFCTDGNTSNTASAAIRVGAENFNRFPYAGDIAEVVIYPRILTSTEISQLNYYFALKYPVGCGLVSSWADQSGNSRSAIQSTEDYRPTYIRNDVNNNNVVSFNKISQYLESTGITGIDDLSALTFFICYYESKERTNQFLFDSSNQNVKLELYKGPSRYFWCGSGFKRVSFNPYNVNIITSWVYDGSQSSYNRLKIYDNGSLLTTDNYYVPPDVLDDWGFYKIHDTSVSSGNDQSTKVYSILIYNSALSDEDRGKVEDYLGTKYSITIS